MPVVTKENIATAIGSLSEHKTFSLDLETTGLNPYTGAKIFSCIISTKAADFYFNFNAQPDHLGNRAPENTILPLESLADILETLDNATVFIHNAKFDQRFLLKAGYDLEFSKVICTQALARLMHNRLTSYSLDNLGKLIGHEKDDTVAKYINKHKLYTMVDVGKKQLRKDKHFNLIPFDIISSYGMQDGRACYELGMYELKRIEELNAEQVKEGLIPLKPLVENEIALTKVLLEIEDVGVKIDRAYTTKAYEYQRENYQEIEEKFLSLTGLEFEDRNAVLRVAFTNAGLGYGVTKLGNPSFSDENLPDNTLGNLIRDWRHSYKLANTYYRNFLDISDANDIIHCNFKQSGTSTGRFSCSEPNLQNVPKHGEDTNKYPVRGCFIPREDYFFLMIDYDQQEYRLLLDLAGEIELIRKIKEEGLDVHAATGLLCGLVRQDAKQVNFAQVYGQGVAALAKALGKTIAATKAIRLTYFRNLKNVKGLISALISTVEKRGYIVNPFGRRLLLPVGKNAGSFQIPNHYIQGGCGDIVKIAMVRLAPFLKPYKSRMLLQVHDELVFELHKDERHIVPDLVKIMKEAYKEIRLPLTAGTDYSTINWYEKKEYTNETNISV